MSNGVNPVRNLDMHGFEIDSKASAAYVSLNLKQRLEEFLTG